MGLGACTLLGPEGPGRPFGRTDSLWPLFFVAFGCRGLGDRPYFENYTVDASILKKTGAGLFLDLSHLM